MQKLGYNDNQIQNVFNLVKFNSDGIQNSYSKMSLIANNYLNNYLQQQVINEEENLNESEMEIDKKDFDEGDIENLSFKIVQHSMPARAQEIKIMPLFKKPIEFKIESKINIDNQNANVGRQMQIEGAINPQANNQPTFLQKILAKCMGDNTILGNYILTSHKS